MAFIKLYRKKLQENYQFLDETFKSRNIQWGVVSKLLCGNKIYLKEIIALGVREIHDSRVSNLKKIKALDPEIQTVYIKPPQNEVLKALLSMPILVLILKSILYNYFQMKR